ncbi:hypothetical protein GYMLUDRAFT_98622 [Collybiopsis luxurians FD-317 M1]|uniref:F-box domain-containing protein n=1 Tax=Collybiopsis luxurians FD-317 M1 TaxID=944289 RepID=A0A0D0C545_9AGAR|nr:hypothetical protein GYMLUDRAFT_98622 [Collybiopsis luxurians FD-317 M1]
MMDTRNHKGIYERANVDLTAIRNRLRSEFGSAVQSKEEISETVAQVDKVLQAHASEIHRLHSRIIFLQNQDRRLESYRACLSSLAAPIRKVPSEVLLRIFAHAASNTTNQITSKKLETLPALSISWVSSHWRRLAKSCPALWSHIRVDPHCATPTDDPILDLYLSLSQSHPLYVEFYGTSRDQTCQHQPIVDSLIACSDRWRSLNISHQQVFKSLVMGPNSLLPSHFPILEEIVLAQAGVSSSTVLDLFKNAPNLRRLTVRSISLTRIATHQFPWRQLTFFRAAELPQGTKEFLQTCCRLKEIQLEEPRSGAGLLNPQCVSGAVAPALEKLSITLCTMSAPTPPSDSMSLPEAVFTSLSCPNLTSLYLENKDLVHPRPWPKQSLHAFISRSSSSSFPSSSSSPLVSHQKLTTLTLLNFVLSDSKLLHLLQLLPALLHLTVADSNSETEPNDVSSPLTPVFFHRLHAFPCSSTNTVSPAIVRRLRSISFTYHGAAQNGFGDKEFVEMVSSRWAPSDGYGYRYAYAYGLDGSTSDHNSWDAYKDNIAMGNEEDEDGTACLRSVSIRFPNRKQDHTDEEVYQPLKHLEKAGMRVVVSWKNPLSERDSE